MTYPPSVSEWEGRKRAFASFRGGLSELPRKPQEPGRRSGSSPFRTAGLHSRSDTDLVRARSALPA